MKTIALMTVKNEEWIIDTTFPPLRRVADKIIVADNNSTDDSSKLLKKYDVEIISNDSSTPSNTIRWKLFDTARERYGPNNLIICIDADEIIPPALFEKNKEKILTNIPGTVFSSPWVQVWRKVTQYRSDKGIWNPATNRKPFMFIDNGKIDYERTPLFIDHVSRIPEINVKKSISLKIPLIHLQFVNWERSQIKQLWYQCMEVVNGNDIDEINNKYKEASNEENIKYKKLKKNWTEGVNLNSKIENFEISDIWYVNEIKAMVNELGEEKFAKLNILNSSFISKFMKDIKIL